MNTARLKQTFQFTLQGINQLLWPAVCLSCKQNISETDDGLCKNCWSELLACTGSDYCPRCGKDVSKYALLDDTCPECRGQDFHFDAIARCGLYSKLLQQMILTFKNDHTELGPLLGFLADTALQVSAFSDEFDFFVPVPLHWMRKFVRGYNQSHILAKKLNHHTAKINTDLVRIRYTKQQPAMTSPAKRRKNVAGAFAVRKGHKFSGRSICLIDDIKTTGATLNECAKVLKAAGANKVFALVLAVAGQNIT